jgi:hypothetical protein
MGEKLRSLARKREVQDVSGETVKSRHSFSQGPGGQPSQCGKNYVCSFVNRIELLNPVAQVDAGLGSTTRHQIEIQHILNPAPLKPSTVRIDAPEY